MKVTATQQGYIYAQFQNPGMTFEIPDEPSRKLTKDDDALTQSIAIGKRVPQAFASSWMRPGWDGPVIEDAPVQSHLETPAGNDTVDLNGDVI